MMLEKGVESQGAAKRGYDKHGLRNWQAKATNVDSSNKTKSLGNPGVSSEMNVSSNKKRSRTH